jgi:hypothetical protein
MFSLLAALLLVYQFVAVLEDLRKEKLLKFAFEGSPPMQETYNFKTKRNLILAMLTSPSTTAYLA